MMLVRRVAIVLIAVGLLGVLVSPWLDGSQARYVHIRWHPGLTADELQALEWRYGLRRITGEDRSYGYDLVNDTRRNIRALLNDPTVEDSADFDIGAASVGSSAPVGIARTGFAWRWGLEEWIPGMVRWSRLLVLLGTVLLVGSGRWPAKVALIVGRSVSSVPPQMVRLTAGFALLLVGAGVFAAMPLLQGEATRSIGIRWRDAMDQDLRETLEERYGLRQQFSRGFNYRYDLVDESPQNIEKLLAEPSVEATSDIDRTRLTANAFSPQGDTRTGLAWKWGIEQYLPRLSPLAAAAMIVGLAMIMGWRRIGRMGAGFVWVGRRLGRRLHPWRTDRLREWWVRSGGDLHSMNLSMMTAAAIMGVFAFALLLRWLTLTSLGGDDHYSLWTASTFLLGDRPFHEFVGPGDPLYWGMSALAQWAVGYRTIGEVGLGLLLIAFAIALSFRLSWQASGSLLIALGLAVVTAALVTSAKLYSYPKIFLYPLGIWLAWRYIDRPGLARSLVLALGVAIGFGYRHDHGAYLAVGASAAVLAAHWRSGLRDVTFALCRVGALTVLILSPYLLLIQANEGLIPYFADRMRFAAQTDAAGRRAVPFVVDETAPLLFAISSPRPVTAGIRWADTVDRQARAELERRYGFTSISPPPSGGWHPYVITDYSERNLTELFGEKHLVSAEGVVGSFRRGFALDEPVDDDRGSPTIAVRWNPSASREQIEALERAYSLSHRPVEPANQASDAVTYAVGDSSIANVTALREHELVEDIRGIHFVRVPVNIRLRERVPVGPGVSVTWADSVTAVERRTLEHRYGLVRGQIDPDSPGGPTWEYELENRSDANVSALARNPRVLFVDQIEPGEELGTYRVNPWSAPRGGRVRIMWDEHPTDTLERRYHLQPDHGFPVGTIAYNLEDASRARIGMLLSEPAIVDVFGIDKERLRPVGTTWFSALRREHSVLRAVFMPRFLFKENAGVWLYWICVLLPFVVFAVVLVDVRTGRTAGIMSGEAQKMFAAAALIAVVNYALLKRLGTFADHVGVAAVMGAWLLARAFALRRGSFARIGIRLATTGILAVSIIAAWIYVDAPTFANRLHLTLSPAEQWALNANKFRLFSMSPPIDYYAPPDAEADRAVLRYLYECTRPDDRIFVTSDSYTVPYYTQRRVVGHIFWANGLTANPDFERRMIELMERDPVPLVFGVGGERPLDNLEKYPLVRAYVAQRYTERHAILQDQLAGRVLWLMTDSRRAPSSTYARLGLPCFA